MVLKMTKGHCWLKAIGQRLFVSLAIPVQGGKEMGVKGIIVNIKKTRGQNINWE